VLLLVLPIRCIESKYIGSFNSFDKLLQSFGFIHILPTKTTPRLAFYVLGCNNNEINAANSAKSTTTEDGSIKTVKDPLWMQLSRASVFKHIDTNTLSRFSQDLNQIAGPNEFSIVIPSWLLPEATHKDQDLNAKNKKKSKKSTNLSLAKTKTLCIKQVGKA